MIVLKVALIIAGLLGTGVAFGFLIDPESNPPIIVAIAPAVVAFACLVAGANL